MGRRNRRRERSTAPASEADERVGSDAFTAPTSSYEDRDGNLLELRGSLTLPARREYAGVLAGSGRLSREDAWQRAVELLFERLAVRWVIAGAPIERQRELLARFRVASTAERAWIRDVLREHCAEYFPELQAP